MSRRGRGLPVCGGGCMRREKTEGWEETVFLILCMKPDKQNNGRNPQYIAVK